MIYTKTIGDRQVFSDCHTIKTNEGSWISNPTLEQILEAGWIEYVPPVIPPAPELEPSYDMILGAVKNMLSTSINDLTDEEALEIAALYPTWLSKLEKEVTVGERLWYNEKLYKVIQNHTVQISWTPDTATSLFVEVSIEEIPEWKQPTGAQDTYMLGDKVKHNNYIWESEYDNNVWEPGVYGWIQQ